MSDWTPPSGPPERPPSFSPQPPPPPQPPPSPPAYTPPSHPPYAPPPATWQPVDGDEPPKSSKWLPVLAVLVVVVLLVGLVVVLTDDGGSESEAVGVDAPPASRDEEADDEPAEAPDEETDETPEGGADEFNEVIDELIVFVEGARGLEFLERPVVNFQDDEAFEAGLLELFEEDLDPDDLAIDQAYFEALGLIDDDTDIEEIYRKLFSGAVLGYYSFDSEELFVRGGEPTPYARQTLAHELVHALEDQHFGIDREELDEAEDERALGFLGLIEGSAEIIGQQYGASLDADERRELAREEASFGADFDFDGIPFFLLDNLTAPYIEGPQLVAAILDEGGSEALDAAFEDPPVTSEQWLDPRAYLEGEGPVPVPEPSAGGEEIERGPFGALFWQSLLFFEVSPSDVTSAVDGWGGDSGVLYTDGDLNCVSVNLIGDTDGDTQELFDALDDRGAAGADEFSLELDDGLIAFTSCG